LSEKNQNTNQQFTQWVNDYSDQLYSWAYHKTSSKEIAEDLVQETFLSAFKGIDNFKNESQPKTWLFRILNNKIIDHYRKAARKNEKLVDNEFLHTKKTDDLFEADGHWKMTDFNMGWEEEEHLLDNHEFNTVLNNCIHKLPEKWRAAIESKYQSAKKAEEICKELNITSSNYWQIVHRAKLQLKICIEKNWMT